MKADKLLHFFFGTLIAFGAININLYYGFAIAILISVGKEVVYDKLMKKGTFDWWDMAFGVFPALLIFLTRLNSI